MGNLWSSAWRDGSDDFTKKKRDALHHEINNLRLPEGCHTINLFVIGLMGSGKSSLVNTFITVTRDSGVLSTFAVSHPWYHRSTTKRMVDMVQIDLSNGATVHIFDCPGIPRNAKITETFEEDLIKTIKGHIKSGYKFQNNTIQEQDEFYRKNPTTSDKMHCVLFVVDGNQDIKQNEEIYSSLKSLQSRLEDENIPIRLILTKADKFSACGYSGLSNIFWSTDAENKVKQAEEVFDLQESQVYPIANYVSGTKQNITQDVLALLAMRNIFEEAFLYIKFDYTFQRVFQNR